MDIRNLKPMFSPSVFNTIYNRFQNLSRFARLDFDWIKKSDDQIIIKVWQFEKLTDKVYDDLEIRKYVRENVDIIQDAGIKVHINILPYKSDGMGEVSAEWVRANMLKHGLSQRALAKEFGVDEFSISRLLNNQLGFTRWHKAAFWFYFTNY